MKTLVIIDSSGAIINRVVVEDKSNWSPADGLTAIEETTPMAIGGTYLKGAYTPPPSLTQPELSPITAVTPRQARLALLGAGLLPQVETAVSAAGGATQITWEYASTFERGDPLISSIGSALNLTDSQIDNLFKQAATL